MTNPFEKLPFLQTPTSNGSQLAASDPLTQPVSTVPAGRPGWLMSPTPTVAPTIPPIVPAVGESPTWDSQPFPAAPKPAAPAPTAAVLAPTGPAAPDWSNPYDDSAFDDLALDDGAGQGGPDGASRGSRLGLVARRILGLDRGPKRTTGSSSADWLDDGQDEPPTEGRTGPAAHHVPTEVAEASQAVLVVADRSLPEVGERRPRRSERSRRPRSTVDTDSVAVTDVQRSWPARAGRGVIWAVVGLIFIAGINQVILRPLFESSGQDVVEQGPAVDLSAAQAAAIRYALDYFSYSPDTAAAGTAALRADVDSSTVKRWTGTGYLASDSAAAGPMVTVDDSTALVPVTLRVRLAMPPARAAEPAAPAAPSSLAAPSTADTAPTTESAAPSSRPAPSAATAAPSVPGGAAGDPGQIPAGWTDLGSRWVTVSVPVRAAADGSVRATGGGAILVGESVTAAVGTVDPMADSDLSSTTNTAVDRFFTGYAASDTSYVSAPGVDMTGLNGVVTAGDRTRWSADLPATTGSESTAPTEVTQLTGTAGVTWQLTGTDLEIVQTYRAAMTLSQGRWYVAQLAPSFTNQ